MNCEKAHDFLDAYSTDELDLVSAMEVESHLADCANCASDLASIRSLRRTLREPSLRYAAPSALRDKLEATQPTQSPANHWRVARIAAMILLFLLPCIGWYVSATRSNATQLADEITASHVRSLQGDHLLDVPSTDQHTVKPWFSGKIDFSPTVADFKSEGFPLVGGRLDYIERRTVAAVVYQHGKHVINVFAWPTTETDSPPKSSQHNGFNLITWRGRGLVYAAVSDMNEQDLSRLVELLRTGSATTNKS
jgi:anti-sigma factor RsiW